MSNKQTVVLTSTEIAALWSTYISESMSICLSKHFLKYMEDDEVKTLLYESLSRNESNLQKIRKIFMDEQFPIPRGYTDEDVNLSAPALFFNLFPLSYIYGTSKLGLINFGMFITSVVRDDVRSFFTGCLSSYLELYNKTTDLMLSKGIYDRPAYIPYPDHIEYLKEKDTLLSRWFQPHRPLNVLELTDIFFNIERNFFGITLLTAFIQVVQDIEIKKYLLRGKALAQQQIQFFNEKLIKDDLLGTIMVNTEVSTSTVSPFSDRLILGLVTMTNSMEITYIGHAISTASRIDLTSEYTKLLAEIMKYGKDGMDMMVEREWMEEPPHAPDRKELAKV